MLIKTDYTSGRVFGIILVPEEVYASRCVEASTLLSELSPSLVHLNPETSVPHITIVHLECSAEDATTLWKRLSPQLEAAVAVDAFTLYMRADDGKVWTGLDIHKTPRLAELHSQVLAACADADVPAVSEHGDNYWPHITLARWQRMPDAQIPIDGLPFGSFRASPVLAEMNKHGTAKRVIARV